MCRCPEKINQSVVHSNELKTKMMLDLFKLNTSKTTIVSYRGCYYPWFQGYCQLFGEAEVVIR